MTQDQIDYAVAKAVEARKIIQELRDAGLIKDSYYPLFNSSLSAIAKKLKGIPPQKDK
jgi:uncharacterized membrane protein